MAESMVCILQQQSRPIRILKWKVKKGRAVTLGSLLLLYDFADASKKECRKFKADCGGIVHRIVAQEGDIVNPGMLLIELKECYHPTIMNDMCAECGADLRKDEAMSTASVPMIHAIPELKVSMEVAQKLGKADNERLLRARKLVLLVDLDQTLIHTTNDNIPANIRDVYHFQLHGPQSAWYHTRLRPGTHKFLQNIHAYYELHICTFGARHYAHMIATFLDADQNIFSNRILSRDECFDPTSKTANLKALFPCGDDMVCIIDDREDVWSHASNLIHVRPYHFFRHTGDINAPPGLGKQEQDEDSNAGVDLTKTVSQNNVTNDTPSISNVDGEKSIKESESKDKESTNENSGDDKSKDTKGSSIKEICTNESQEIQEDKEKTENNQCIGLKDVDKNTIENSDDKNSPDKSKDDSKEKCHNGNARGKDEVSENLKEQADAENSDKSSNSEDKSNEPSKNIEDNKKSDVSNGDASKISGHQTDKDANKKVTNEKAEKEEQEFIDVEDPDDYLIYLEEILKRIHHEFYNEYDYMESGTIPDLKEVIPRVRSQVLKDYSLVFSGLVPNNMKLEQSKAYQVARGLGAEVTQDLNERTTHLVAVRLGTVKVNSARRVKQGARAPKIVTPDWLWCCAERWELADERLFPLSAKGSKNRHPPPHCGSPTHPSTANQPAARRKRTASGRFMDTINPLMSFSSADIAEMGKEVEDMLSNESSSSSEGGSDETKESPDTPMIAPKMLEDMNNSSSSSSSLESLTAEYPRGFKRKRKGEETDDCGKESTEDESPGVKFRRGEDLDTIDMDQEDTQDSNDTLEPPEENDDEEWNAIGAALERNFLSNN